MSLKLTYRKARSKDKKKAGTYYVEGTDHEGERVHRSLRTGDRDLAKALFAKEVAKTIEARVKGAKGVANFANAVKVYLEHKTNSNEPYLNEMLPLIGTKKLCELTQADLDDLAKRMRPGASKDTLKRQVYTPFIAAYNAAVDNVPPLADHKRWKSPAPAKRRADAPNDAYIGELSSSIDVRGRTGKRNNVVTGSRKPARDKALLLFITLTGARSGEAQRLQVRDLQLDRGFAILRRTKNGNPRQTALAPLLVEALQAQVTALGNDPEALVFECETRWGIPQLVKRLQKRAGMRRYRPHVIGRHAFASRLLNAGESTITVKDAGGWSDTRMIDQHYGHLEQQRTDKVVSGIDTSGLGAAASEAQGQEELTPNSTPTPADEPVKPRKIA